MKKKLFYLAFFCLMGLGLSACMTNEGALDSSGVDLKVLISDPKGEISSKTLGGMNLNNSMNVFGVKDYLADLSVPTITFPAGNVGDDYDLTFEALKFLEINKGALNDPFTFVQFRLFGGSVEQAVEIVRQCQEEDIHVDVWTVGNEPDLYASHRGAPEWTPEYYCEVFRQYSDALRAEFPDIKLAGPTMSNIYDDWMETFIRECGDIVDVLLFHWYPTDGHWEDAPALATAHLAPVFIERYRSWLLDPEKNPKGWNRDIEMGVSEFALHWDTPLSRHLTDMTAVLWTSEVLGYFAEQQIDYSHYFCFHNYGAHALFNVGNKPRPVYPVFSFYSQEYYRNQVYKVVSGDDQIHIFASSDMDGNLSFVVVNESPEVSKRVYLDFAEVKQPFFKALFGSRNYSVQFIRSVEEGLTEGNLVESNSTGIILDCPAYSVSFIRSN